MQDRNWGIDYECCSLLGFDAGFATRSVSHEKIVQDEQNFVNRKYLFVTVFRQLTFNKLQKPLPINKAHTLILGLFNDAVSNVIQH